MSRGESRICGCEGRIFGDSLLQWFDAQIEAMKALLNRKRAAAKKKVVRFGAGLIAPLAVAQLKPQAVHNTARNLILNRENIFPFTVKFP